MHCVLKGACVHVCACLRTFVCTCVYSYFTLTSHASDVLINVLIVCHIIYAHVVITVIEVCSLLPVSGGGLGGERENLAKV